ncbi:MAG: restriction endonuclease subunit S [Proteobacteria bacterium]|nr:restriction endonuclease subunit S [Pseudomonadota bacterium]
MTTDEMKHAEQDSQFFGELPKGWILKKFGDILSEPVRNGVYKKKEFHGRGQKIINMGELFAYNFISNQEMKRVELNPNEVSKSIVQDGDLLFARRSLVLEGSGKCSLVVHPSENLTFESSIIRARPDRTQADSKYYYYLFQSRLGRALMASIATQTTVSGITGSNLMQLKMPQPPLLEQHKIAAILSAYDDLIENNTRHIKILEEMAQALYSEWFVKFRFPGHEKVRMVESELGMVPEGWEIKKATDAIYVNPTTKVPKEGEKPFVSMGNLSNDSMFVNGFEYRSGNSGSKFKNGDTLFARITPCLENGKTAYVQFLPSNDDIAFGSTEFIVLRSKTLCSELVYLMARSNEFRDNAIKSMSGATGRQRVQEACFDKFLFAHPDSKIISAFAEHISPLFQNAYILNTKNANLRRTRDLLLPKLISGEIDIQGINIIIGGLQI